MSYESFDDIKFDLGPSFKGKWGHLVLSTQEHVSGGYTFASGTDAGRPLSSFVLYYGVSIDRIYLPCFGKLTLFLW